ncbi:COX15/CtaA family protein [Halovivax cerinus]|uniref:COX15/CtaA family protein n=1 Tax=Halovivax cerinus TaxID=1487865 RepID=A0ABD5NSL7_9EURY|nr:COX15/CtaA family protein [Halovivax cerinus]
MASTTRTEASGFGLLSRRFGVPELVGTTLVLVSATILLGIATKASGAGLACDANWPLCDGGILNLFPATFPSFFEWIHRVVAGVSGLFIVASAIVTWRSGADRTAAWALTIGLLLTPVQVALGAGTVKLYDLAILDLHFWTAIAIFCSFAVGAIVLTADRLNTTTVTRALGIATVLVPAQVVLSPLVISTYTEVLQTTLYAVTLVFIGSLLFAAIVGRRRYEGRTALVLGAAPILGLVVVYFGRESVMGFDPSIVLGYWLVTIGTTVAFAWLWYSVRTTTPKH